MHRIDGAGHVNNLFVAEDLATQRPPTEITPEIMNAFQEELASFVEWAGLVLAKGDNTQLRQALQAKFAGIGSAALLDAVNLFTKAQRGAVAALPATTGSVALDLGLSNNWEGTLTGNFILANPSNVVAGQSGVIRIVNDATPRSIAYGSVWKSSSGVLPGLTAAAGAVDLLGYYVESAARIWIGAQGDSK